MDKIRQKFGQFKEFLGKYSKKTKLLVGGGALAILMLAFVIALVLNHKEYAVLFSGITEEEATKIVGKLQESGIDFQYKGDGEILVDSKVVDEARANLAYEGYPQNGFSYDVFTEHAGGMTTDTETQMYILYDLQNRIGATIRLFDGVKEAKVTIALNEQQKYVLEDKSADGEGSEASASVVVTMENGGSPSEKQAEAIQRLVAKSVPEMKMENVGVFDGNGLEVSVNSGSGSTSGDAAEQIAQLIETQISKKIINVLAPFYGSENIRVSAKGTVNMEKVVRESTTFNTPEKKDENDKTGIISNESTTSEASNGGGTVGGVAGAETNADTPLYNAGDDVGEGGYGSQSATRDYLVNQVKEQGQLDPGVLEDLTISVALNDEVKGNVSMNQLQDLVGNATGIEAEERENKITIVRAPFYQVEEPVKETTQLLTTFKDYLPVIIAGCVLALIIIIFAAVLMRRARKRRQNEEIIQDEFFVSEDIQPLSNPEMLNVQNEKSRELRENVRDFADENPEISAQMIRNWLNGGKQDGRKTGE